MPAATQPPHPAQGALADHATWAWSVLRSGQHGHAVEIARQLLARTEGRPCREQQQQDHHRARGEAFFLLSIVTGDQLAAVNSIYHFQQIPAGSAWQDREREMLVGWAEDNWRSILHDKIRTDLSRAPEPFYPSIYERRQAAHRASATETAIRASITIRGVIWGKALGRWRHQQHQQHQQ